MPATTVAICKFVGTISLGLLTGVSYTLSTQSLPSLLTLPSAKPAAYTISQTTRLAALHTTALSAVSTLSLLTAYALSPPRARHPYLLWTALAAGLSGALTLATDSKTIGRKQVRSEIEFAEVNGEQVEKAARDRQLWEFVRASLGGVGFAMGVVGIWGDGA